MENQEVTSPKYSINWKDFLKSLGIAVGTDVLFVIQQTIDSGSFSFDWKHIGMIALASVVTYLTRNFFRSAKVVTPK